MQALRIKGLVRLADGVRRELAQPIAAARQEELRERIADAIKQVDQIVARHGTTVEALPTPSRRAYEFLAGLNLESVASRKLADTDTLPEDSVALVGLKSFWTRILDGLARPLTTEQATRAFNSIRATSENVERHLQEHGFSGRELTSQTSAARGWLAFFGERENFDAYVAALGRARPILEASLPGAPRFVSPVLMHFRPISGLYRLRGYRNATRLTLPTPMITFSAEVFDSLAHLIFQASRSQQRVLDATATDDYQSVQAELESLCGVVEKPVGMYRDLAASFERVNREYFGSALARPRLTWSRTFTGRKFGHYDPIRDTVMISATLDREDLPEYALDFVVYHELLHKQLGINWRQGRMNAHTREFRAAERRFVRHADADAALSRLARGD